MGGERQRRGEGQSAPVAEPSWNEKLRAEAYELVATAAELMPPPPAGISNMAMAGVLGPRPEASAAGSPLPDVPDLLRPDFTFPHEQPVVPAEVAAATANQAPNSQLARLPQMSMPKCVAESSTLTAGVEGIRYAKISEGYAVALLRFGDGSAKVVSGRTMQFGQEMGFGPRNTIERMLGKARKRTMGDVLRDLPPTRWAEENLLYNQSRQVGRFFTDQAEAEALYQKLVGFAAMVHGLNPINSPQDLVPDGTSDIDETGLAARGSAGFGWGPLGSLSGDLTSRSAMGLEQDRPNGKNGKGEGKYSATLERGLKWSVTGALRHSEGWTRVSKYEVIFDETDQPLALRFYGERYDLQAEGGEIEGAPWAGGRLIEPGGVWANVSREKGIKGIDYVILDLRNPANRAAFDAVFTRVGRRVYTRTAEPFVSHGAYELPVVSLVHPTEDIEIDTHLIAPSNLDQLEKRIQADAVVMHTTAEVTTWSWGGAKIKSSWKGLWKDTAFVGFGSRTRTRVLNHWVQDNASHDPHRQYGEGCFPWYQQQPPER